MSSSYLRRSPQPRNPWKRNKERERETVEEIRQSDISLPLLDRSFILGNQEKYRIEFSTEFYLTDLLLSLSLSFSSAEITRKQRAGDRMEKYVGDQISSNAARLLARVYLSGDRPSENRMKGKGCARITCLRTRSDAFKTIRPLFRRWEKKYLLSTIESWRHSRGSIHGKYLPANLPPPPLQPSIKHSKNKFPLDQGGNFCCVDFRLRSR